MGKAIKKARNTKGDVFALVDNQNSTWTVYALCQNYDSNCRGGMRKTWRYVNNAYKVDRAVAVAVFERRAGL